MNNSSRFTSPKEICCPFALFGDGNRESIFRTFETGMCLSFMSVLFNCVIFFTFYLRNLSSPATILMQGLALADGLTAFSAYGMEPLFQNTRVFAVANLTASSAGPYDGILFSMNYPFCGIYVYLSYFVDMFHLVSVLLTTCLGVQKVVAIQFPFWTRNHLTKKKSVICCASCFLLSIGIHISRLMGVVLKQDATFLGTDCYVQEKSENLTIYLFVYYQMIMASFLLGLCLIMVICTIFTVYKLSLNSFRRKIRKTEKRSILLIIIVLILFLLTDTPKLFLCGTMFFNKSWRTVMIKEARRNAHYLGDYASLLTDFFVISYPEMITSLEDYNTVRMGVEFIKLFSVIGSLSNFIIYILMSAKLRRELKQLFSCCNKKNK